MPPARDERDATREAWLSARLPGVPVHAYRCVTSTMDLAHELAAGGAREGALVWAQEQRGGRGRHGRIWQSPPGGLYCSVVLYPQRPAPERPQLALVAGLAVAETLDDCTRAAVRVRWPNDVLLGEKKVAGVLTEGRQDAVVVGLGVNVHTDRAKLPELATSLAAEDPAAAMLDLCELAGAFYERFMGWYARWGVEGFAAIHEPLDRRMGLYGRLVEVAAGVERCQGQATALDESGRLVVRLDSGVLRAFDVGDVTLLQ